MNCLNCAQDYICIDCQYHIKNCGGGGAGCGHNSIWSRGGEGSVISVGSENYTAIQINQSIAATTVHHTENHHQVNNKHWQCEYCNSINKNKKLKCQNCGAPRRNIYE